jgi:hypothetical protein
VGKKAPAGHLVAVDMKVEPSDVRLEASLASFAFAILLLKKI